MVIVGYRDREAHFGWNYIVPPMKVQQRYLKAAPIDLVRPPCNCKPYMNGQVIFDPVLLSVIYECRKQAQLLAIIAAYPCILDYHLDPLDLANIPLR